MKTMIGMSKLLTILALLLLVSCSPRDGHWASSLHPEPFVSNGERIYFTGKSVSGNPIDSVNGGSMMGMHRQMHGGGCAVCHGAEREGRRLWPQFWIKAPALTAEALFADDHENYGHGDHDHVTYNSATLGKAIIEGIDPDGKALDAAMPRWSMSDADLRELIAYLQQSHIHE